MINNRLSPGFLKLKKDLIFQNYIIKTNFQDFLKNFGLSLIPQQQNKAIRFSLSCSFKRKSM